MADADPGGRGTLVIRERVVTRIACTEALAVDGVVAQPDGLMHGRGLPRAIAVIRSPDGSKAGSAARVIIALTIAVRWPVPMTPLTTRVQRAVARKVEDLTGLEAAQVDVTVEHVVPPASAEPAAADRRRVS